MIGAIIGDIAGSRFEFDNFRSKDFELFTEDCSVTDDSIMSLAIARAILECGGNWNMLPYKATKCMQTIGQKYPDCGYGGQFYGWVFSRRPRPYNSYGNGAAMRVSACVWAANSLQEAIDLSKAVTAVTHNHPEGIKGAEATVAAAYLARDGKSLQEIRNYITAQYYQIDFTLDEIRPTYQFNETCQNTVPQAMEAFFESVSFEDAIRNAVSIGGDSDTIAAITGTVAEACYGVPESIRNRALSYLDDRLSEILFEFEKKYPPKFDITMRR